MVGNQCTKELLLSSFLLLLMLQVAWKVQVCPNSCFLGFLSDVTTCKRSSFLEIAFPRMIFLNLTVFL